MNNNHLKIITDNASIKPQSQQVMSSKSSSSGAATPTSDLVDDSGVSEDNASSVNSGSEQGSSSSSSSSSGSIYRATVRTTPKSFATTPSRERDSDAIDNDDIDDANNNTINKSCSNANHQIQAPPASSIIHLSPGGSAVIEYKTVSNLTQKSNIIPNTVSSFSNNSNPVIVSTTNGAINGTANIIKTVSTQSSTLAASTPHTHFHKKYIKAMNAMNGSGTDTVTTSTPTPITNSNSEAQISSPSTIVSVSAPTTIYTIPMKTEFRYFIILFTHRAAPYYVQETNLISFFFIRFH